MSSSTLSISECISVKLYGVRTAACNSPFFPRAYLYCSGIPDSRRQVTSLPTMRVLLADTVKAKDPKKRIISSSLAGIPGRNKK